MCERTGHGGCLGAWWPQGLGSRACFTSTAEGARGERSSDVPHTEQPGSASSKGKASEASGPHCRWVRAASRGLGTHPEDGWAAPQEWGPRLRQGTEQFSPARGPCLSQPQVPGQRPFPKSASGRAVSGVLGGADRPRCPLSRTWAPGRGWGVVYLGVSWLAV